MNQQDLLYNTDHCSSECCLNMCSCTRYCDVIGVFTIKMKKKKSITIFKKVFLLCLFWFLLCQFWCLAVFAVASMCSTYRHNGLFHFTINVQRQGDTMSVWWMRISVSIAAQLSLHHVTQISHIYHISLTLIITTSLHAHINNVDSSNFSSVYTVVPGHTYVL